MVKNRKRLFIEDLELPQARLLSRNEAARAKGGLLANPGSDDASETGIANANPQSGLGGPIFTTLAVCEEDAAMPCLIEPL